MVDDRRTARARHLLLDPLSRAEHHRTISGITDWLAAALPKQRIVLLVADNRDHGKSERAQVGTARRKERIDRVVLDPGCPGANQPFVYQRCNEIMCAQVACERVV